MPVTTPSALAGIQSKPPGANGIAALVLALGNADRSDAGRTEARRVAEVIRQQQTAATLKKQAAQANQHVDRVNGITSVVPTAGSGTRVSFDRRTAIQRLRIVLQSDSTPEAEEILRSVERLLDKLATQSALESTLNGLEAAADDAIAALLIALIAITSGFATAVGGSRLRLAGAGGSGLQGGKIAGTAVGATVGTVVGGSSAGTGAVAGGSGAVAGIAVGATAGVVTGGSSNAMAGIAMGSVAHASNAAIGTGFGAAVGAFSPAANLSASTALSAATGAFGAVAGSVAGASAGVAAGGSSGATAGASGGVAGASAGVKAGASGGGVGVSGGTTAGASRGVAGVSGGVTAGASGGMSGTSGGTAAGAVVSAAADAVGAAAVALGAGAGAAHPVTRLAAPLFAVEAALQTFGRKVTTDPTSARRNALQVVRMAAQQLDWLAVPPGNGLRWPRTAGS